MLRFECRSITVNEVGIVGELDDVEFYSDDAE